LISSRIFPSCAFSALALACAAALGAQPLPALDAEDALTVSGLSSGGFMAVQMHVAYSGAVRGAGIVAGGPYYCARGSLLAAYFNCTQPGFLAPLPPTPVLRAEAESRARSGEVDPIANLAGSRVWLFSGSKDPEVEPDVMKALFAFYREVKADAVLVDDQPAGHGMPTASPGTQAECAATRPPFVNACGYDAAGELLRRLYGKLAAPGPALTGRLVQFDQRPFGDRRISMDDSGYAFIPLACEKARCRVHIAFHGCRQGAAEVQEAFVRDAGYNRWADANRLIVLYPQAVARSSWGLFNPRGCWDWWGYTGPRYHTREGAQARAVMAMVGRLQAPRK
jgi:poly(3-hydroxybutyrate) depolymerase